MPETVILTSPCGTGPRFRQFIAGKPAVKNNRESVRKLRVTPTISVTQSARRERQSQAERYGTGISGQAFSRPPVVHHTAWRHGSTTGSPAHPETFPGGADELCGLQVQPAGAGSVQRNRVTLLKAETRRNICDHYTKFTGDATKISEGHRGPHRRNAAATVTDPRVYACGACGHSAPADCPVNRIQ